MALSATISVPSSASFNQVVTANVTLSNSGGSPVTVTSLKTIIQPLNAPNYEINSDSKSSGLPKGFGQSFISPAGGSVQFPFSFVINSPQVAASSSALASPSTSYTVGCAISTSDGSVTSPTPASFTIIPLSLSSLQS